MPALFSSKSLGLLAAILLIAAGLVWAEKTPFKLIPPLVPDNDPMKSATFRDGAYFADPAEIPRGLENRGSRVDGVEYRGEFVSGWFKAQAKVGMMVAGFPRLAGNRLVLEIRDEPGRLTMQPFDAVNPLDSWRPWTINLPPEAVSFRVRAVDGTSGENGWLGVTQPFTPTWRPSLWPQATRAFFAFGIQTIFLLVIGLALARVLLRWARSPVDFWLLPLVVGAAVALVGYLTFWIYFALPNAGRVFSWLVCGGSALALVRIAPSGRPTSHRYFKPVLLAVIIGIFYTGLLVVFESPRMSYTASRRFVDLPSDNEIPRAFAERLLDGKSPRHLWGDWLSSDRPPLQTGWLLLTWPILKAGGFDADTISTTGGICFQLLWVLGAWSLARYLGADERQALAVVAAISFTGVMLIFSVFVWPKLGAAALSLGAVLLWLNPGPTCARRNYFVGGLCAALGWLSHGGVAFSLLGFVPLMFWFRRDFGPYKIWALAVIGFAVLAGPWVLYQRLYEPPANRLFKMHLAGVAEVDPRGFLETVVDSYGKVGWLGALENKTSNVLMLFRGDWTLARLRTEGGWVELRRLRGDEFTYTARSFSWWISGLVITVFYLFRKGRPAAALGRRQLFMTVWVLAGLVAVTALLFVANAATVHQGTLITQLVGLTLLAWWALTLHRYFFTILFCSQVAWFLLSWIPVPGLDFGPLQPVAAGITALAGAALLWTALRPAKRVKVDLSR